METNMPEQTNPLKSNITLKGILIGVLVFVLMIPTFLIQGIIHERESRQHEAVMEVSNKWGGQQQITGPVLVVPYEYYVRSEKTEKSFKNSGKLYILPEQLEVNGVIQPEIRHRGIFEVVLYGSDLSVTGSFKPENYSAHMPPGAILLTDQAQLLVGIPDLRGLREQVTLNWQDSTIVFDPGMPDQGVSHSGIHCSVPFEPGSESFSFSIALKLKGSGSLSVTPVGKETKVELEAPWADPSFNGAFLPETKTITKEGFSANWKVLHLNRNYPQIWNDESINKVDFSSSAFGVSLILPIDNYQKATRSVKYAILFIALTFLAVFFIELRQKKSVHPFQYALIGLALIIFYTLLISISEHLSFNMAYGIAAIMTIGLSGWYARSLFNSGKLALLVSGTLTALYGFLFVTLQLQDLALLIGSLGLFVILAVVMYVSRKIKF